MINFITVLISFKIQNMKKILIIFVTILILSGCSTHSYDQGLTPMPSGGELSDAQMKEAIAAYLKQRKAPPYSEYKFARTDLNGDNRRDAIVLFKVPHTYWCGWDGCGMLILKAGSETFTPVTTIKNVRGPIYIPNSRKNGWRDIIIRISGANMADKNVVMSHNGRSYPKSPLLAPDLATPVANIQKEIYFK